MKTKLLAMITVIMMLIAMLPVGVSAAEPAIQLTTGTSTVSNLNGTYEGIRVSGGAVLTLENCTITLVDGAQISISSNSTLILKNSTVTMNGVITETGLYDCALYFAASTSKLVVDHSTLTIDGYGANGGYCESAGSTIEIINDSYVSITRCRAAITHSAKISVIDSVFVADNNRGNAFNGANFTLTNADISVSGNGSHGMSCGNVTATDSVITIKDNGLCGIYFGGGSNSVFDEETTLIVSGNGTAADSSNRGAVVVTPTATVEIKGEFVAENNTRADITNNGQITVNVYAGNINIDGAKADEAICTGRPNFNFSIMMFMLGFGEATVVDQNGEAVVGAEFDLYTARGTKRGTYVTDENGQFTTRALMSSTYYLVPAGETPTVDNSVSFKVKGLYDVTEIALVVEVEVVEAEEVVEAPAE